MKTCKTCGKTLPMEKFGFVRKAKNGNDIRSAHCGPCRYKNLNNTTRDNQDKNFRMHGTTRAHVEALLVEQGNACAICGTDTPGGKGFWHIDHDHRCCPGKKSCGECIRGLLCHRCNAGIGFLGDNPTILMSAANYVNSRSHVA